MNTRACVLTVATLGVWGCGGAAATPGNALAIPTPSPSPTNDPAERSLGTIASATPNVACGSAGAGAGAVCTSLVVRCPGIEDLEAVVAVTQPLGTAHGTVFAHAGGGGTDFYGAVGEYLTGGLRVVQVRWTSDWEQTGTQGILEAACRPATVMQWTFDNVHGGSRENAFCGVGHSGGSAVLAYSLAHYGMGALLDYAALGAGPPFGRIDYGCAPQTYSGPLRTLCPENLDAPIALPPDRLNRWENTTSCGSANPLPDEIAIWAADSVVSPGGSYDYPNTQLTFWDCAIQPNGTTGGAYLYSQQITSSNSVTCFTMCKGEALGDAGQRELSNDLLSQCTPRHAP